MTDHRFQDQNKRLSKFQQEVWVVCPNCSKKAITTVDYAAKQARLFCSVCGYNAQRSTEISLYGATGNWQVEANLYFDAELWLKHPFKNDFFFAYNAEHLDYLESYIAASLREHKDRTHFTLLEKLPRFYHEAKNREALLKIIQRLKNK